MFIPNLDLDFYPSRIQGSKRHRITDPDPEHWIYPTYIFLRDNFADSKIHFIILGLHEGLLSSRIRSL